MEVYHDPDDTTLGTVLFTPFIEATSCATPTPTASPTQSPTATPTPTATATATPTPTASVPPSPTPSPTGASQQVAWGDNNCSGNADPVDALLALRHDAGLTADTGDCPEMGEEVDVQAVLCTPGVTSTARN